jgi:hypothetical protein
LEHVKKMWFWTGADDTERCLILLKIRGSDSPLLEGAILEWRSGTVQEDITF